MESRAYLIPGFGGDWDRRCRTDRRIAEIFEARGIEPIPVRINWEYKTMTDYAAQFLDQVNSSGEGNYTLGFSFGAFISFITSPKFKPRIQILCSLSPYFREDLKHVSASYKSSLGVRRIDAFRKYSFNDISGRLSDTTRTVLMVGEKELDICLRRACRAHSKLRNSELVVVEGAGHKIDARYLEALEKIIGT